VLLPPPLPPPPAPEDETLVAPFCSDTGVAWEFDVYCAAEVAMPDVPAELSVIKLDPDFPNCDDPIWLVETSGFIEEGSPEDRSETIGLDRRLVSAETGDVTGVDPVPEAIGLDAGDTITSVPEIAGFVDTGIFEAALDRAEFGAVRPLGGISGITGLDGVEALLTPLPEADRPEEPGRVVGAKDIVRAGDGTGPDEIGEVAGAVGVSARVGSSRMDGTV
jgi:hypothetical protein